MKNGYKKIMAALLASAMAVTTCIPAFAASHKISSCEHQDQGGRPGDRGRDAGTGLWGFIIRL